MVMGGVSREVSADSERAFRTGRSGGAGRSGRLVIFDAGEGEKEAFAEGFGPCDVLFSATPLVRTCTGCFGCWTRTPGACVLRDRCSEVPSLMARAEELVLVSPVAYGGYSRNVKAVLERSIGYLLPFFRMADGEMHHALRYPGALRLAAHFYGPCSAADEDLARRLVAANAENLGASACAAFFHEDAREAKEALV